MATFAGQPSDGVAEVLATGRTDVAIAFVSMSARHPEGRDEEYITWHSLDHRPEQHRLAGLRGSLRLVSTPACRRARAMSTDPYDAVDHVMTYLFADPAALGPFMDLGRALGGAGRMPVGLPSVEMGVYELGATSAASRVVAGADVIPWRPARGAYLILEQGAAPAGGLVDVPGVAGVWSYAGMPSPPPFTTDTTGLQLTYCYLDDDPVESAGRLNDVVTKRWADNAVVPLLAAPFHTIEPYDWGRYLPG